MNNSEFLKQYANSESKFLTLGDGEEVRVKFLGVHKVTSFFSDDIDCLQYILEYEGAKKYLTSASRELAFQMAQVSEGSMIVLKRIGKGMLTKYEVTTLISEKSKEGLSNI